MKKITKYLFCFLAVSLAFGAFNPFDLQGVGNITEHTNEQRGFTPILYGLCTFFSLFDKNVRLLLPRFQSFFQPLMFLLIFYVISTLIFDASTIDVYLVFFLKLFVAILGFISFSIYFYVYPSSVNLICRIFSITCTLICVAYFLGLLDGFYYISNGRLWLFGENPNSQSFIFAFAGLLLVWEITRNIKFNYKILYCISVLLIILFLLISGSRGSLIFFVFSLIILFQDFFKRNFLSSLFLLTLLIISTNFFVDNSDQIVVFERLNNIDKGDSREQLFKNAFSLFLNKPLIGYGLNGYQYMKKTVFNDLRDSHNMILSIMAVSGILGFSAIMTFYFRLLKELKKCYKNNKLPIALFVFVFLISMKTGGIITYSMMWFGYAVILSKTILSNQALYNDKTY